MPSTQAVDPRPIDYTFYAAVAYQMTAVGLDGTEHLFEKPIFTTVLGVLGNFTFFVAILIARWSQAQAARLRRKRDSEMSWGSPRSELSNLLETQVQLFGLFWQHLY